MVDEHLRTMIMTTLKEIFDPEIPVNIVDLGLIYDISFPHEGTVQVTMTLTNPACPIAGQFPALVQSHLADIPGIQSALVVLTWDPPWTMDRMTDAAKLQLGLL